jgi:hypothetical protein
VNRHLGAEVLARYRAGDLSARRSSRIARHVAGCDRCSALGADLDRVTALLAATPVPPMPDHLAGRVQAAISAESAARTGQAAAAGRATAGSASASQPAGEGRPARPVPHIRPAPAARKARTGRPGRLSWLASPAAARALAAAGAAAVLAGGGYLISQNVGPAGTSSAPGSASAAAPAVPSAITGPELHYGPGSHQMAFRPITTDANLSSGNLAAQVRAGLAAEHRSGLPSSAGPAAATIGPSGSAGVHHPASRTPERASGSLGKVPLSLLEGCVGRLAGTREVLLVDVARYKGAPATLIVVRIAVTRPVEVWVVGPDCSASASDVLRHATLPAGSV